MNAGGAIVTRPLRASISGASLRAAALLDGVNFHSMAGRFSLISRGAVRCLSFACPKSYLPIQSL
jgi:hypothetical protein